MGGFTAIYLKDTSIENIEKENAKLRKYGVAKKYRFYSDADIKLEFEAYKNGDGHFPEHRFPKGIRLFSEFKQYWSTKALGECFCPHNGSLTFDCYFGRTSNNALRRLGKYVANNHNKIIGASGSFSTFIERGMTKREINIVENSNIIEPMRYL